jgi:hypothetical protein
MIRLFNDSKDWDIAKSIHERNHAKDFPFEYFSNGDFLARAIIDDGLNNAVLAGGVKLIPEIVLMTDLDKSVRVRRDSLIHFLRFCKQVCDNNDFSEMHCFPLTSDTWTKHLVKYGFKPTKGNALVMEI